MNAMVVPEEKLQKLKQLHALQGKEVHWQSSEYMRGLYNGMELALAILEEREPSYKDDPEQR